MAREARVEAEAVDQTAQAQNTVDFDEKTLAEASISGSSTAFEELYTHYYPKVRGFCLRKTSDAALAEDIAQEAFARAFERINDFGGPKHFGGWVGTIAANLITDHYRRKRNSEVSLDAGDPDRGPSYDENPIRNLQRADTSRLVKLAMDKLDPRQREALVMHEVRGMTCAAVGDALGISEVAAESLLARARRRLRKEVTAKAAPADLFGLGGLGLLPALWRAWRRAKEATVNGTARFRTAAAGGFESMGTNLVPTVDGAKALVVVLGAALAVEVASAAAPPVANVDPTSSAPASAQTQAPAFVPADGDASDGDRSANLPVSAHIDPEAGRAGAGVDGTAKLPDIPGSEGYSGLVTDLGANLDYTDPTNPGANLHARLMVVEEDGDVLADTGEVEPID